MKNKKKWIMIGSGDSVTWCLDGDVKGAIKTPVVARCQFCLKMAVVALPSAFAAEQKDGTSHVLLPGA